ncbi:MAG: hypothetical protein ACTSRG_16020 [Candidatus Helarchaeota archaeon]
MIRPENKVTCNFCGSPDPIYYCNKCNTVFCSRCKKEEVKTLVLCASCGTIIGEIYNNDLEPEIKYKCHKCKSTKYIIGQKRSKHCPGCNKSDISTIAEKKRKLIETSRKLIFGFRAGYKDTYTLLKKLDRVRSQLINLRTSGFFHDPRIETILLKLIKSIPIIKNQIMFRVEQDHKILKNPLQKFLEPTKWTPDKFFLLEASLNQIKEVINNFRSFLDELLSNAYKDLNIILGKMKAINYYKNIYDECETLLDILPGELPICAFKNLKFKKATFKDYKKGKGILFLTDRRMIFLRKRGIIFKKYEQLFDFFLEGFEKVELVGKIFKKLKFYLEEGALKFAASAKIMRAIINYFHISINFEKFRAEAEIPLEILEPIDLNLLDLKEKIEVIITSLLSLNQASYLPNGSNEYEMQKLPHINPNGYFNKPTTNMTTLLFNAQEEEFSLKNTLQNLELKFNQRIISPEEYIRQFRYLQSELYAVRRRIQNLKNQNHNSSNFHSELTQVRSQFEEIRKQNNNDLNGKKESAPVPLNLFDI